ncbi:hypothetical protein LTR37_006393 [Vermiconidia calcicola]|uniref:Uncharacterized protein n=1 Tax=Vermiconidia calcicola TaxID=1690605 RepID=A0ACC3NH40_9PEZI|nr:hypothetical protein LTR37_006393 [Vermiconidia calcicola]
MGCLQETGLRTLARSDQYTEHAQRFMRMGRQMGNVNIDYDIYLVSLKFLEEVFDLIKNADPPPSTKAEDWKLLHQEFRGGNFREVTALVNQREMDFSKSLSLQSAVITRRFYHDAQSLRIIQWLGLVFLPLSLCASIFGMGFFDTSDHPADPTRSIFSIPNEWWWFLALSIPLTIAVLLVVLVLTRRKERLEPWRRLKRTDLENIIAYEMTPMPMQKQEVKGR